MPAAPSVYLNLPVGAGTFADVFVQHLIVQHVSAEAASIANPNHFQEVSHSLICPAAPSRIPESHLRYLASKTAVYSSCSGPAGQKGYGSGDAISEMEKLSKQLEPAGTSATSWSGLSLV